MNEIEIMENRLPDEPEKLVEFILIGNEAIKAYRAKIRACKNSETAMKGIDVALETGKRVVKLIIEAENRLGEILEKLPKPKFDKQINGSLRGTTETLPSGLDKKQSHYAQEIHKHPEIVEEVFKEYENKDDIPTRNIILKKIAKQKHEKKIQEQKEQIESGLDDVKGLYDIISVDPPWEYKTNYNPDTRRVASPYPEMSTDDIKNIQLPIKKDCTIFLWTTQRFIWDAKNILDTWGFDYVGIITWNKIAMGIGVKLRFQCEFCLVGTKGKPLWEAKDIRDYIEEKRGKHSRKPDVFFNIIDNEFVGRKLDYFGREKRDGWDIYGVKE